MTACSQGASSAPLLSRGVRRALDAMRANVGRDWSLTDLAGVSGMSGRTLQRQFRSFLGKTPRAVLRDIRFEFARRELLHGSPGSKVMDVAEDCGLTHFGRFSVEYRRRYGETPSQTRKRQVLFINALASTPAFFIAARDRLVVTLGAIEAAAAEGGLLFLVAQRSADTEEPAAGEPDRAYDERDDERRDRGAAAGAPARRRGRQIPFSGHCASPCRRPKPQAFIMPTWHSEKSKRTGSTGSMARSDAVMSAAIRHPGDR